MKRKLIAFDIDGTLLTSNKKIQESTLEVLHKLRKAGHYVTVATGRNREFAMPVINEAAFEHYVLCNGSAAFTGNQQVYKNTISTSAIEEIIAFSDKRQSDLGFQSLDATKRSCPEAGVEIGRAMNDFCGWLPDYEEEFYKKQDIYQMLAFFKKEDDDVFAKEFPQFRFVRWESDGGDIVPVDGSKANTLKVLAEQEHIEVEDMIAFGDGNNDVEMLQTAGIGIAMGNATEYVKQHANEVTDSSDENGIWKACVKLGLV